MTLYLAARRVEKTELEGTHEGKPRPSSRERKRGPPGGVITRRDAMGSQARAGMQTTPSLRKLSV